MAKSNYKNRSWIDYLVEIGQFIASIAKDSENNNVTVVLCLPRVDYAAAFIGVGIIKASHVENRVSANEVPLHQWIGNWVTFENNDGTNIVGVLEYCKDRSEFKIRHYKRKIPNLANMTLEERAAYMPPQSGGLWDILQKSDWSRVTPIGREFNEGRRVGSHQINRVINTNKSIANISKFLDFDFSKLNISTNKTIFDIYCNKSRITMEISDSLSSDSDAILSEILKPKESNLDTSTHYCEIKSNKIELNSIRGSIMLIESGNLLSDHLVQSRRFNRVILLGRNMPNYQESAHLITQERCRSAHDIDIKKFKKPEIKVLAFATK
jgi:hypothetical protein